MGRKALIVSIAFVLIVLGAYLAVKELVFPVPENCKACHFIAPFYKKWQTSTHNKVPCLKCHDYTVLSAVSGQMRFLAGTYNPRPITKVPDKNCLQTGCHDKRLIESKTIFTKRGIVFDHKPHFTESRRGINLHCRSCHSDIVQGEHVKASMNPCFLCHFKGAAPGEAIPGCPSCHTAPMSDIVVSGKMFSHGKALKAGYACKQCHLEVERGTGIVPEDRCFFCHVDRAEHYKDVELIHKKHVAEKQIDCLLCHPKIEHGKIKMKEKSTKNRM